MDMEKSQQVRQIIADTLFLSIDEVGEDASQDTLKNWDSLQQMNIVLALEQSFGVRFKPEEFTLMTSIEKILQHLQAKQA